MKFLGPIKRALVSGKIDVIIKNELIYKFEICKMLSILSKWTYSWKLALPSGFCCCGSRKATDHRNCWAGGRSGLAWRRAACAGRAPLGTRSPPLASRPWGLVERRKKWKIHIPRLWVIWGQCCPRVAAAPSLPNGRFTQLSPYFTRKPGTILSRYDSPQKEYLAAGTYYIIALLMSR